MRTFTFKDAVSGAIHAEIGDKVLFHEDGPECHLAVISVHQAGAKIGCEVIDRTRPGLFGETREFEFLPSEFMNRVKEMREAQKEYFSNRSQAALQRAKKLESEIDKLIP